MLREDKESTVTNVITHIKTKSARQLISKNECKFIMFNICIHNVVGNQ